MTESAGVEGDKAAQRAAQRLARAQAHGVLALARRAMAHDINNALTVLQGHLYLLHAEPWAAAADETLDGLQLACARLQSMVDELGLADRAPGQAGEICDLDAAIGQAVSVFMAASGSEVECAPAGTLGAFECGVDTATLRGLASCTLRMMAAAVGDAPLRIAVEPDADGGLGIIVSAARRPARPFAVRDPCAQLEAEPGPLARLGVGLWDVGEALHAAGGRLDLTSADGDARLALILPGPPPSAGGADETPARILLAGRGLESALVDAWVPAPGGAQWLRCSIDDAREVVLQWRPGRVVLEVEQGDATDGVSVARDLRACLPGLEIVVLAWLADDLSYARLALHDSARLVRVDWPL